MSSAVADRVVEIVRRELRAPAGSVTAQSKSADVEGWDSLAHLQVCMAIEAEFNLSIELDVLAELDSVPALVEVVEQASR